jgi:hypothetical protein
VKVFPSKDHYHLVYGHLLHHQVLVIFTLQLAQLLAHHYLQSKVTASFGMVFSGTTLAR